MLETGIDSKRREHVAASASDVPRELTARKSQGLAVQDAGQFVGKSGAHRLTFGTGGGSGNSLSS
jgi:hypothetical protein